MERKEDHRRPNIDSLLQDLCEGRLDTESGKQLSELLSSSDEAVRRYVELMHVMSEVREWAQHDGDAAALEGRFSDLTEGADLRVSPTERAGSDRGLSKTKFSTVGWFGRTGWAAAIAVGLLVVLLLPRMILVDNDEAAASRDDAKLADAEKSESTETTEIRAPFVAQVVEATEDVVWQDGSAPEEVMLRVRSDDRIAIESGVIRLKFDSGASVILHGPAVFTPTGVASGYLASGRLTGEVGNASSEGFRLLTPGAEVIDLGTAFGVAVGDAKSTDVYVFDGAVEVSSLVDGSGEPVRLEEGMSVRLSGDGNADLAAVVDHDQFLRKLPMRTSSRLDANEVSLVDAFVDGPGLSHRLFATLDPKTGKPDEAPSRGLRESDEIGYRLAVYSEFVDGVLIPSRSGAGVQIDSYGSRVELPRSVGRTYGPIWARRPVPGLSSIISFKTNRANEVWEVGASLKSVDWLENCRLGVIGLQPNVGISFDLRAIQSIEGQSIERFHCLLANLGGPLSTSSSEMDRSSVEADVHVYVDGLERFSFLALNQRDGAQPVDVALRPFDRVLSIVVTISGGEDQFDQVVLIDPLLELAY